MKVKVNYFKTVNEALAAVSESAFGFEIIGAEGVTKKADFEKRAKECKNLPFCMVDFIFTPESNLVGGDLYSDRFEIFYDVWSAMLDAGINIDQFIITANKRFDGRYDYHILASLIDGGGYTAFDPLKVAEQMGDAMGDLHQREMVQDLPVRIDAQQAEFEVSLYDMSHLHVTGLLRNPLCHELVVPFRDYILRQLKDKLFE